MPVSTGGWPNNDARDSHRARAELSMLRGGGARARYTRGSRGGRSRVLMAMGVACADGHPRVQGGHAEELPAGWPTASAPSPRPHPGPRCPPSPGRAPRSPGARHTPGGHRPPPRRGPPPSQARFRLPLGPVTRSTVASTAFPIGHLARCCPLSDAMTASMATKGFVVLPYRRCAGPLPVKERSMAELADV